MQPGAANRSYGIEVGRLAGLPTTVLARARKILHSLEGGHLVKDARPPLGQPDTTQLGLGLSMPHPVLERLRALDPDTMTPLQALQQLADFRKELS